MSWTGQNTIEPEDLIEYYTKSKTLERARFWYENWRKVTALIDPPAPWEKLDIRIQVAMCSVFDGGVREHERNET